MTTVWVVDIDDTVLDHTHRLHLLQHACSACGRVVPYSSHPAYCACGCDVHHIPDASWKAFCDPNNMVSDKPIESAQRIISKAVSFGVEVHFITGRTDDARAVTQSALTDHFGFDRNRQKLLMRPMTGDRVAASVYKERAFRFLKTLCSYSGNEQFSFFDDDIHVLGMYSKHGMVYNAPMCWNHMEAPVVTSSERLFVR